MRNKMRRIFARVGDALIVKNVNLNGSLFFVFSLIAGFWLGVWGKSKSVEALGLEFLKIYPLNQLIYSGFATAFFFAAFSYALYHFLNLKRSLSKSHPLVVVLLFLPIGLIPVGLSFGAASVVFLLAVFSLVLFGSDRNQVAKLIEFLSLVIIFATFYHFFFPASSPIFDDSYTHSSWARNDHLLTLFPQVENAKNFSFLGKFSQHRLLGSFPSFDFSLVSEVLGVLAILFDIPIINWDSQLHLLKSMLFALYITCSVGKYYFVREGLCLARSFAFFTGAAILIGNAPFLAFHANENIYHHSELFFLPISMLCIVLGARKNRLDLIFFAGFIQGCSEYFISSYPPVKVVAVTVLFVLSAFVAVEGSPKSWARKITLYSLSVGIGLFIAYSWRMFDFLGAIINAEYLLSDPHEQHGFFWNFHPQHFASLFFTKASTSIEQWHANIVGGGINPLHYWGAGVVIGVIGLPAYFLFPTEVIRQRPIVAQSVVFLFFMTILLLSLQLRGKESWLSQLMIEFEIGRFTYFQRLNVFTYFFATLACTVGLSYLIEGKCTAAAVLTLLAAFSAIIVILWVGLHNHDGFEAKAPIDLLWLIGILAFLIFATKYGNQNQIKPLFLLIVFCSSVYATDAHKVLGFNHRHLDEVPKDYQSLTSGVVSLRGNYFDKASHHYLYDRFQTALKSADTSKTDRITKVSFEEAILSEKPALQVVEQFLGQPKMAEQRAARIEGAFIGAFEFEDGMDILNFWPTRQNLENSIYGNFPNQYKRFATLWEAGPSPVGPLGKYFSFNSTGAQRNFGSFGDWRISYFFSALGANYNQPLSKSNVLADKWSLEILGIAGVDTLLIRKADLDTEHFSQNAYSYDQLETLFGGEWVAIKNPQSVGLLYSPSKVFLVPQRKISTKANLYVDELSEFKATINKLTSSNVGEAAVVEKLGLKAARELDVGKAKLKLNSVIANKAGVSVNCPKEHCFVVYNIAALDGWRGYAKNFEIKIQKTNFGFIGFEVPQGLHDVVLEFSPTMNKLGFAILTVGFCVVGIVFARVTKADRA